MSCEKLLPRPEDFIGGEPLRASCVNENSYHCCSLVHSGLYFLFKLLCVVFMESIKRILYSDCDLVLLRAAQTEYEYSRLKPVSSPVTVFQSKVIIQQDFSVTLILINLSTVSAERL